LTRSALRWSAERVGERLGMGSGDVGGLALPIFHVGGFGLAARCTVAGSRLVSFRGKWDAGEFVSWLEREGVTVISLVPTQVRDLVQGGYRGNEKLRVVVVGGGIFEEKLAKEARHLGWPVLGSYGMTEAGSQVATEREFGGGLEILEGWEVVCRDGVLWLRGEGLFCGYVRRGSEGFSLEDPREDGWFQSSDAGIVSGKVVTIMGRMDRRVKVLGELVDLEAIENWFRNQLGYEVRVEAEPEARKGCQLVLWVETKDEVATDEGVKLWNRDCVGFERIDAWRTIPSFRRSALGKIIGVPNVYGPSSG